VKEARERYYDERPFRQVDGDIQNVIAESLIVTSSLIAAE
jgi:hypothetical protein